MPINERLMKPGSFDLELIETTPKAILDLLQPFGHIGIFNAPLEARMMADADLWADALYMGILREKPTPFKIAGAHITAWLGDEEGKAWTVYEAGLGPFTHTFAQWLTDLGFTAHGGGGTIQQGTWVALSNPFATVTQTFKNITPRAALDWLCAYFTTINSTSIEYRMWGQNRIDVGAATQIMIGGLVGCQPAIIATPFPGVLELSEYPGLPGQVIQGITPQIFSVAVDANSYSSKIVLVGGAGQGTWGGASPYKDPYGNTVSIIRVVTNSQTAAGQEATVASAQLGLYGLRQVVTLSTLQNMAVYVGNNFALNATTRLCRAGDWIWVYDPEHGLSDEANVTGRPYAGSIVFPVRLRVYALTWPVEGGMGVYYRDLNGVWTDLTNWVKYEPPGTSFELGAPTRGLTVF